MTQLQEARLLRLRAISLREEADMQEKYSEFDSYSYNSFAKALFKEADECEKIAEELTKEAKRINTSYFFPLFPL